jgi:hypothetical protein
MKRTALIICLAAIMLLALAVPAFADGSSGTVYGKAVLAPYAIVLTGGGTDSNNPLTYQGNLGQEVGEEFGSWVTVQNIGTAGDAQLTVTAAQLPSDGNSTWNLGTDAGPDTATWTFFGGHRASMVLPDYPYGIQTMEPGFYPGQSESFQSSFAFPTSSSSSGDHFMQATIAVSEQE